MKSLLRSSLIVALATASFAGIASQASNSAFPTAPRPTSAGGTCGCTSVSLK